VVIEGSWIAGGIEYFTGQMVIVEPNVVYGPFECGKDGVTCIEFFEHQDAVPPIWDEADPAVQAVLARLGDTAASVYRPAIA